MKVHQVFLSIFLTSISLPNYANKILPVFSGHWFAYVAGSGGPNGLGMASNIDSCGAVMKYELNGWNGVSEGRDIQSTLLKAMTFLQCKKYIFKKEIPGQPNDFPTTESDFQEILKVNNNSPKIQHYEVHDCASAYYEDLLVEPTYVCPKGTRPSYDNHNELICTTPRVCVADVVGRDLNVGGLGWIGHIGLAYFSKNLQKNMVVEVLNKTPVVNVNTLASFEAADKYWGERYNPDKLIIRHDDAEVIIQTGKDQATFDPEYTLTTDWHAGSYSKQFVYDASVNHFQTQYSFIRGKFRCDTFVNYCYTHVLPKSKVPIGNLILPKATYESFSETRTDVPLDSQYNNVVNFITDTKFISSVKFLEDNKIATTNKMQYLDARLKTFNENQYEYAITTFAQKNNSDIIPWLMNKYNEELKSKNKIILLSAIASLARQNNSADAKLKLSEAKLQQIISVQQFLRNRLINETDALPLLQAIEQSFSLLPINDDTYALLVTSIDRLEKIDPKIISIEQKYIFLIGMAYSTEHMKNKVLPYLISSHGTQTEFKNALNFIKKNLNNQKM